MRLLFLIATLVSFVSRAQNEEEYFHSESIADGSGAAEVLHSGSYAVQFTGGFGLVNDLTAYKDAGIQEKNALFFKFTAPYDGKLSIDANISTGFVQMLVFQNVSEDIVSDIANGTAILQRVITSVEHSNVGLSLISEPGKLTPIDLRKEETVMIMFNTSKKGEKMPDFSLKFEMPEEVKNSAAYKKVVDQRKSGNDATFHILVRDAETGTPVIADLNIKDKRTSSLYSGSDFYFNPEIYAKLVIKCDAPGYFFSDKNITVYPDSSKVLLIDLKPVSQGKILKIDKIEFVKGTADLLPGSETILNRVKDFLVLNAELKIEIQGHVNDEGNDNLTTKALSRKRAKKIMQYFVQSGVNRKRLGYIGYGNQKPIYGNPKNEREAQANRRVEIKIL